VEVNVAQPASAASTSKSAARPLQAAAEARKTLCEVKTLGDRRGAGAEAREPFWSLSRPLRSFLVSRLLAHQRDRDVLVEGAIG